LDTGRQDQGLFSTRYGYDRTGNLTARQDSAFGKDSYLYDPMGRILQHTDPWGVLHAFFNDPAGDRLVTRVAGARSAPRLDGHNDEWRREGTYQGTLHCFDRAGNLTHRWSSEHQLALTWDANQHLVLSQRTGADGKPQVTSYAYDPLGRRLYKETACQRTWFGWDGDAVALDVIQGQAREFVYRPESFEPLLMLRAPGLGNLHYVNDPNGCPTRLVDIRGHVRWAATYSAWGEVKSQSNWVDSNPLGFQGQYSDNETDLLFNRHRFFCPAVGQFVSADPLGLDAGENLYELGPNPWTWVDPLGLKKCNISKTAKKALGSAPAGMLNPHMHHIVMEGAFSRWTKKNRSLITQARTILRTHNINIQGKANVVWAQNAGHSVEYAKKVLAELKKASPKGRDAVITALDDIGKKLGTGTF
jgi:RHS repeat-associated protein